MRIRFLADADLDQDIVSGMLRREPAIDFALPQDLIADGTDDLDVLAIAAAEQRILVTHDLRTMPYHFSTFVSRVESPGLILIPRTISIARVIEELLLVWHVSDSSE